MNHLVVVLLVVISLFYKGIIEPSRNKDRIASRPCPQLPEELVETFAIPVDELKDGPLEASITRHGPSFGRYISVPETQSFPDRGIFNSIATRKFFTWASLGDGDQLVTVAFAVFGHSSSFFVGFYDKTTNVSLKRRIDFPLIFKFFGPQKIPDAEGRFGLFNGCVSFPDTMGFVGASGSICGFSQNNSLHLITNTTLADISGEESRIEINAVFHIPPKHASFVFPTGGQSAASVTKASALQVSGPEEHGKPRVLVNSKNVGRSAHSWLGSIDFTIGDLARHAKWHWMAATRHNVSGSSTGLQLSNMVYEFGPACAGSENLLETQSAASTGNSTAIRTLTLLDERIAFEQLDSELHFTKSHWRVSGTSLDLVFTPRDAFPCDVNYWIVSGFACHIWGTFSGTVQFPNGSSEQWNDIVGTLEYFDIWW